MKRRQLQQLLSNQEHRNMSSCYAYNYDTCRSPEERFYQYGSEPKVLALTIGDLGGPAWILVFGILVSIVGFVGETTIGCNWGATSARGVRSPGGAKEQFNFGGMT